jgi:hypothetical protein
MILGLNNNFKYKDTIFHVQTEDTGTISYHVATHLYFKGTIISSKKTYYGDAKSCPELNELVKELIEAQHKKMLMELSKGVHDQKISEITNADI